MNKKDLLPVIILALMIPVWIMIDRTFIAPKFPAKQPAPAAVEQPGKGETNAAAATVAESPIAATPQAAKDKVEKVAVEVAKPAEEEIVKVLANDKLELELTSWGAGIKSATLSNYPELNEEDSPPVVLDFSDATALAYDGYPGIGANDAFAVEASEGAITFSKKMANGLVFQRTITLTHDYLLDISDRFTNPGSEAVQLDAGRILTGRMKNPADMKATKGVSILGVDTYTPAGEVNYWGRKLHKLFDGKPAPLSIDAVPEDMQGVVVDWVSAKNKFFTQIIRPNKAEATMAILSSRDPSEKNVLPKNVAAALVFQPQTIGAGETLEMGYTYFLGPKKYSVLKESGYNMEKVMEFETTGFFSWMNWLMEPARRFLLITLNFFDGIFGNYGVAIILLTVLIRILFWPLTHKSTESMKRMQELQPQIKALQEKHKKDPQRAQQEVMKFYKENKVNPMGGCLPMFVQIPVFIALFTVLRNAIELRYAGFLWIADLSQPENLFAGTFKIPIVGWDALNILPIVMSISMIWQQKLSSPATAATPEQQQQQKMMMFMMPIMMLFFFYNMPSGLVLYWTTSNLLMIGQTGFRNFRKKVKEA